MSSLARDFFAHSAFLLGPVFAMFLFSIVFLVVVIRVFRLSRKDADRMASLALNGESHQDVALPTDEGCSEEIDQ